MKPSLRVLLTLVTLSAVALSAPEVTSRLHACGKLTVSSIDELLESRGITGGGTRPQGAISTRALFN